MEDCCAEHPEGTESFEAFFGTPQAVAAAYIDDMDTGELLAALRQRRRVLRLVGAGLLAALAVWLTTCIISAIDLHDATHGWNEAKNIVIAREKQA